MGKTFKDSRGHGNENSRNFRKMPHFKKNQKPIGKCISGKIGFLSETAAQIRAGEILNEENNREKLNFLRVYHCKLCDFYHLTSQEFR